MKRIVTLTLLLLFAIGFTACKKIEVEKDTPQAIKKLIRENKNRCLVQVNEYEYNNKNIYCFVNSWTCFLDISEIYYNDKGKKFGEVGKEIGNTLPNDFEKEAILKRIIELVF